MSRNSIAPLLADPQSRLPGLDWIRGLAAMWVLLYHVDITLQKAKYFGLPALSPFTSVGYRGVELFFLLSGFVMAKSYDASHNRSWNAAASFAVRRVLRIFPAYLVVFLPLFAVAAWKGVGAPPDVPVDVRLFLLNLFLLPRDVLTTYIPVSGWTLTHELMFYALFMVAFLSWRAFMVLLTAWAAVGVGCSIAGVHLAGWLMVTSGLNAYFLLGVLCCRLTPPRASALHSVAMPSSLLLLVLAVFLEQGGWAQDRGGFLTAGAYAGAFFLLVLALGHPQVHLPCRLKVVADRLGNISYGLYLVNYPVVVVVALACKAAGLGDHATMIVLVASMALSILLADLLHRSVEQPAIRLGKRLVRKFK